MILASQSPQRKELLKQITEDFQIIVSNVDEKFDSSLTVYENVMNISECKAVGVKSMLDDDDLILACDTVCYLENKILCKPIDRLDAFNMIKSYNNKEQEVITGCTIIYNNEVFKFYDSTKVIFKNLTDEKINAWLNQNRFLDKAGSFEILESKKYFDVEVSGSISNVIGLPIEMITEKFNEIGVGIC